MYSGLKNTETDGKDGADLVLLVLVNHSRYLHKVKIFRSHYLACPLEQGVVEFLWLTTDLIPFSRVS